MNFREQIKSAFLKNNSLLCVGLDVDLSKLSDAQLKEQDPIFAFNRDIINATKDLVCAYKPNMAFYEMAGPSGLNALEKTIKLIHSFGLPVILDAKRGDIGNTSSAYAKTVFDIFNADATTVSPYMGKDSIEPFLRYKNKGIFVLCLTSNPGAQDFEMPNDLYKQVARKVNEWDENNNCGLVVGATQASFIKEIREIAPNLPFLIPGIGAQGGETKATLRAAGKNCIINASRSIIYSSDPKAQAKQLRDEINACY